jgi:hypothetical protein
VEELHSLRNNPTLPAPADNDLVTTTPPIKELIRALAETIRGIVSEAVLSNKVVPGEHRAFQWKLNDFNYDDSGVKVSGAQGDYVNQRTWFHAWEVLDSPIKACDSFKERVATVSDLLTVGSSIVGNGMPLNGPRPGRPMGTIFFTVAGILALIVIFGAFRTVLSLGFPRLIKPLDASTRDAYLALVAFATTSFVLALWKTGKRVATVSAVLTVRFSHA